MDALFVVHAELDFATGKQVTGKDLELSERIAAEIEKQLASGNQAYFLAGDAESPDSQLIYPAIRTLIHKMHFVPAFDFSQQFLMAKELAINGDYGSISFVGHARDMCVDYLYNLFLGKDHHEMPKSIYWHSGQTLGWTHQKFEEIVNKKLNAKVLEDLCL
jgi:hypothetical protein